MKVETKYQQLYESVRFTDDISFKLLGIVPLVSGATFAVVLIKGDVFWSPALFYLSLFGALITLGLFRWELRNIKTCNYLQARIAIIDQSKPGRDNTAPSLVFDMFPIGKAIAEKFIYTISTLAWLALPCMVYGIAKSSAEVAEKNLPQFEAPCYWLWGIGITGSILLLSIFTNTECENVSSEPANTKDDKNKSDT